MRLIFLDFDGVLNWARCMWCWDGKKNFKLKECERLQGWPDGWTARGLEDGRCAECRIPCSHGVTEVSDTQRYKMAGNGVAAPVVAAIVNRLKML